MNQSKVESVAVDGQQHHGSSLFPYVLSGEKADLSIDSAAAWVKSNQSELLRLASDHGAVLLRGFPVAGANDFDALIQSLDLPNFPYEESLSNAVRVNRTPRVFSANEAPAEVQIFFHHEMAQTPLYPRWIMFSCEVSSERGGATPICRSDVLLERLSRQCPQFVKDCEQLGLRYTSVMPSENDANSGMGRSWRSTLGVESREAAEARLVQLGYAWQWLDDGCLRATTPPLPAVVTLEDGRRVFFNQLIAAFHGWKDARNDPSKAICHADGTPLHADSVSVAVELADELAYDLSWQVGDVVILDNMVSMHGRRPFVGTRKVVASLAQKEVNRFELVGV